MSLELKAKFNFYNKLYHGDATIMKEIPSNSIDLIVTSPPYFMAGKDYQNQNETIEEYTNMIKLFIKRSSEILINGGRIAINIANSGRNPYIPLTQIVYKYATLYNLIARGEIIWNKGASVGSSTAWGSWRSASNPVLRDVHEYILVFSKTDIKKNSGGKINTITSEMFTSCTQSIWNINTISAKKRKHPAPFPIDIPQRLIELYSFKNDIVLDPFVGSGTTIQAAIKTNRRWIGYDTDKNYLKLASQYIAQTQKEQNA